MGCFLGVGSGLMAGPFMFWLGISMNVVVGKDLADMIVKSVVVTQRHRILGYVDIKLDIIMVLGTFLGVEIGIQYAPGICQVRQESSRCSRDEYSNSTYSPESRAIACVN